MSSPRNWLRRSPNGSPSPDSRSWRSASPPWPTPPESPRPCPAPAGRRHHRCPRADRRGRGHHGRPGARPPGEGGHRRPRRRRTQGTDGLQPPGGAVPTQRTQPIVNAGSPRLSHVRPSPPRGAPDGAASVATATMFALPAIVIQASLAARPITQLSRSCSSVYPPVTSRAPSGSA